MLKFTSMMRAPFSEWENNTNFHGLLGTSKQQSAERYQLGASSNLTV